jgi:hypothetical protein
LISVAKIARNATAVLLFLSIPPVAGYAAAGSYEQEIKRLYKELIDDENRHDLYAVRKLVWESPSTLFVAKAPNSPGRK